MRFTSSLRFNARACLVALLPVAFMVAFMVAPVFAQLADGDRHWQNRAHGASGGRAKAETIDAAIAAYQRAAASGDLEAQWKLLRAHRFKGAYVASTNEEKKKVYGAAKKAGEQAIALVEKQLAARGVSLKKATEKQVADAARAIPGAAEVLVWDAVNWGEWALAYGKLAAAREGAADRIRRHATIAHLADPKLDGGTPSRVLGRLHDQTPRIPFVTGWASSKEAVKYLTESMRIDPANKITIVFLAEAMVANDARMKAKAVQLLLNAISSPNDPAHAVEQAAAVEDAKAVLKRLQ